MFVALCAHGAFGVRALLLLGVSFGCKGVPTTADHSATRCYHFCTSFNSSFFGAVLVALECLPKNEQPFTVEYCQHEPFACSKKVPLISCSCKQFFFKRGGGVTLRLLFTHAEKILKCCLIATVATTTTTSNDKVFAFLMFTLI